jgi:hypothetical protein
MATAQSFATKLCFFDIRINKVIFIIFKIEHALLKNIVNLKINHFEIDGE